MWMAWTNCDSADGGGGGGGSGYDCGGGAAWEKMIDKSAFKAQYNAAAPD